jgi:hypothetical protein
MPESLKLAATEGYQILSIGNYDDLKQEDTVIFCGSNIKGAQTVYDLAFSINAIGNKCRNYDLSALNILELSNAEAICLLGIIVNSARDISVLSKVTEDVLKGWGITRDVSLFGETFLATKPSIDKVKAIPKPVDKKKIVSKKEVIKKK